MACFSLVDGFGVVGLACRRPLTSRLLLAPYFVAPYFVCSYFAAALLLVGSLLDATSLVLRCYVVRDYAAATLRLLRNYPAPDLQLRCCYFEATSRLLHCNFVASLQLRLAYRAAIVRFTLRLLCGFVSAASRPFVYRRCTGCSAGSSAGRCA